MRCLLARQSYELEHDAACILLLPHKLVLIRIAPGRMDCVEQGTRRARPEVERETKEEKLNFSVKTINGFNFHSFRVVYGAPSAAVCVCVCVYDVYY